MKISQHYSTFRLICTIYLTIGGTVLKESVDLVILGVTFDSKLTLDKHLHLVSRAASQRLGILRKSWPVFHDRSLLGRCFFCFVLPVLEYCSAVWCLAADTRLKLLDRAVSGARFLTVGVFECEIAHSRSVAVLCSCIRSGVTQCTRWMMRYLDHMCQCGLHAVPWSHIGILTKLCATSLQNLAVPLDFCSPLSVPLEWSCRPRVRWCGTGEFQEQGQWFFIILSCSIPAIVF